MLNELNVMLHSWPAYLQVVFILGISALCTAIIVKLFELIGAIITALPIAMHGWPEIVKSDMDEIAEEDEKSSK